MAVAFNLDDVLPPLRLSGDPCAVDLDPRGVLYVAEARSGTLLAFEGEQAHAARRDRVGRRDRHARVGAIALGLAGTVYATRRRPVAVFAVTASGVEELDALGPRWIQGASPTTPPRTRCHDAVPRARGGGRRGAARSRHPRDHAARLRLHPTRRDREAGPDAGGRRRRASRALTASSSSTGRPCTCAPLAEDLRSATAVCVAGRSSLLLATHDEELGRGAVRQICSTAASRDPQGAWEPAASRRPTIFVYIALRGERRCLALASVARRSRARTRRRR